jgi:hypothetical protein
MTPESDNSNLSLPLALISVTIAILLLSQIGGSRQAANFMKFQSQNLDQQLTQMKEIDKQAAETIKQRETVVKQAGEIQNQLQTVLNDLLDAAEKDKDKDAIEIINKWKVQRNAPPGGAAAAAPAPAAPAADAKK